MKIFGKEIRNNDGKKVDSPIQKLKSWWLGRQLRKGNVPRGRAISSAEAIAAIASGYKGVCGEFWGILSCRVYRGNTGRWDDIGCVSVQKITTAFRDRMVDSLQNSATAPMDVFKYHAVGTGSTAEANTQTALVTEVGARVSGTQTEGATANIYKTVATVTPGGIYAITEHGIFSAASGGILMDRSVFSAINLGDTDSIQFTYEATFNAEA